MLKDAFVHSLSASLKLSTAVAVAGVVIALDDARATAARPRTPARSRRPSHRSRHRPGLARTDPALPASDSISGRSRTRVPTGGMPPWHRQM